MFARYEGSSGMERLVRDFSAQELVLNDKVIARRFADVATIEELQTGARLYLEGELGKNSLFFILIGSVSLSAKKKHIAELKQGQTVGEFPIVTGSKYAVTVHAREQTFLARVPEEQFRRIVEDHPVVWENMARMLVSRLDRDSNASPATLENVSRLDLLRAAFKRRRERD